MKKQYLNWIEKNPLTMENPVGEKPRHNMDSTDSFKDISVNSLRRGSDQLRN